MDSRTHIAADCPCRTLAAGSLPWPPLTPPAAASGPLLTGGRYREVLIGATSGLAMFLAALDFSVNVALPELAAGLDADLQSVQWALVVFMGVRASLVMGAGSFADRFGLRRVYLWGGVAYLVSMFCIALSPDLASVVGFRILHGIGTACMYAVAPAIAANLFPAHRRGLGMGFTTANQALGMVGGTIGAGLLVGAGWFGHDWQWVFWGRVPFMAVALVLAWFFLDRDPPVSGHGPAFDLKGTMAMAIGMITLIVGTRLGREIGWDAWQVIALLVLTPTTLCLFWRIERTAPWPVLPLGLFRNRGFVISGCCSAFVYLSAFVIWFVFPFYVADTLGRGPEALGAMLATASLCGVGMSLLGGWLSDRVGTQMVGSLGLLIIAAGLAMMGLLDGESSLAEVTLWVSLAGAGNGFVQAACYSLVMKSVQPERFGTAGAMLSLTQALGSISAIVVLGGVFALREDHHLAQLAATVGAESTAFLRAYRDVFMIGAAVALVGALVAVFGRPPRSVPSPTG